MIQVVKGSEGCIKPVISLTNENYFCLMGLQNHHSHINNSRKTTFQTVAYYMDYDKVTGSSYHEAVSLNGLQAMKEHCASLTENVAKSTHSDETNTRMNYGIQNEINGTNTRVFKVFFRVLFRCHLLGEGLLSNVRVGTNLCSLAQLGELEATATKALILRMLAALKL